MTPEIIVGAQIASGIMGFKGNRQAAKAAEDVAEYNAQVEMNELTLLQRARRDSDVQLRKNAERLKGTQSVATAVGGVELKGSPLSVMADTYFGVEEDSARISYASSVDEVRQLASARAERATGAAKAYTYQVAAVESILGAATTGASTYGKLGGSED